MSNINDIWQTIIHPILSNPDLQGVGNVIGMGGTLISGVSFLVRRIVSHKDPQQINPPAQKEKAAATFQAKLPYPQQSYPGKQPLLKKITSVVTRKYIYRPQLLFQKRPVVSRQSVRLSTTSNLNLQKKISTLYQTYTRQIPETSPNTTLKKILQV